EQKQSEAEKGIDYIAADPPAYTTAVEVGYNGLRWSVDLLFQLKSPMSTMDVFLVDAQTNEEIGFLGTMDGGGADPYKEYIYRGIMNEGRYYPLTGNPEQPVAYNYVQTEPGLYNIRFVGTNDEGETFSSDTPVYYSITQPTLELSADSGIYEYAADDTTITLSGSVYDPGVNDMQDGGMDVTQGDNKVVYTKPGDNGRAETVSIPLETNGEFTTDIELDPNVQPFEVTMYAENKATVRNYHHNKHLYYVQEGTPYGTAIADNRAYRTDEEVTVTLAMNHISDMKQATFSFVQNLINSDIEIIDIAPHSSLEGDLNVDVEHTEVFKGVIETEIMAQLTGDLAESGLSGQVSLVDVTFKGTDDTDSSIEKLAQFNVSYTNIDDEQEDIIGISLPYFMERTYSYLKSNVDVEAFQFPNDNGPSDIDYIEAGVKVKVTDEDGIEYPNDLGSDSWISTASFSANVPLTDKSFKQE